MNSGNTRGKFVVVKNRVDPRENSDTMIPFSKAELVDMMTWRVFCGVLKGVQGKHAQKRDAGCHSQQRL